MERRELTVWRAYLSVSLAETTTEHYSTEVRRFLDGRDFRGVTEDDVVVYLGGMKPGARYIAYWGLRSFFGWATRRGHITIDPVTAVRAPRLIEREPRALTRREVTALRSVAQKRHPMRGVLVDFLYYTGARIGEAVAAEWQQDRGTDFVILGNKSRKERTVSIHPVLRESLDRLRALHTAEGTQSERLFGRSYSTMYGWIKTAAAEAGLRDVHPHTLRATTATLLSEAGAPARDIQRILGHSSLAVTQRYIETTVESRARSVALL